MPDARSAQYSCSHCGVPVPFGSDITRAIDGGCVERFCCHGCLALARMGARVAARSYGARVRRKPVPTNGSGPNSETTFVVAGIHCAACVTAIHRVVGALDGVVRVDVGLAGRAIVAYDASTISSGDIEVAIAAAGYRASTQAVAANTNRRREARRALLGLFVAGFGMMQVMMYVIPEYVTDDGIAPDQLALLHWASLVLTLPVIAYSARPLFAGAWRDLRNRALGMDVPVAFGLGTAFAASAWATWAGQGAVYFDSVTMFVFLLLGSRYLEMRARQHASDAVDLLTQLQPAVAMRITRARDGIVLDTDPLNVGITDANSASEQSPGDRQMVPVSALAPGDRIAVQAGQIVPVDAKVAVGNATVCESMLTGEATPVFKATGSTVLAGSTVYCAEPSGELVADVETWPNDTRLAAMIRLLDRALCEKPRLGQLADRIAAWFTGLLLALAAATALYWSATDPTRAIAVTIAVLVVSCPCALSLATPSVLGATTGVLARRGLLMLDGNGLETLTRATHIVFDKTGTLTSGEMSLEHTVPLGPTGVMHCLDIASALEAGSRHPAGMALRRAAPLEKPADNVIRMPGLGVEGVVGGRRYRLGSPSFVGALQSRPREVAFDRPRPDQSLVALGDDQGWIAAFFIGDTLREGAATLLANLRALGLRVSLLSGDRSESTAHWARELGVCVYEGDATPQRKKDYVRELQAAGDIVVMIGDGANDMGALGIAHASIAVGTAARLGVADRREPTTTMVWLGGDLRQLDWAIAKSRFAMRVVRQNLAWAFVYNLVAIPLAVSGWLTPWQAGLGMSLSSLLVVANALRVLRDREGRNSQPHVEQKTSWQRVDQALQDAKAGHPPVATGLTHS